MEIITVTDLEYLAFRLAKEQVVEAICNLLKKHLVIHAGKLD